MIFNKISKDDWQYILPVISCFLCLIATDLFEIIEKTKFAYWSGALLVEPHRIVTSHFIHGNTNHFFANVLGIVIARYCFKVLMVKGNSLFLLLIGLLIPIQSLIFWSLDIFIFKNKMSIAIGFSGILYGVYAFILLSSIYGKKTILNLKINIRKNYQVRQIITVILCFGLIWSLIPNISFSGHFSGFIAGIFLFFL
tara:strand:- start:994 stop:1584 length:591 start_codon:yes stop_codon:yes gene_type:complete